MEAMLSWIVAVTSKLPTIPPRFIITPFKAFTVPRNSGTHTSEKNVSMEYKKKLRIINKVH